MNDTLLKRVLVRLNMLLELTARNANKGTLVKALAEKLGAWV